MDEFTTAYIEAALWSSNDENDVPLDRDHTAEDIAAETKLRMIEDCTEFQKRHAADITENPTQAGHDFWLTRNGHGAGFWDGDWSEDVGERLTSASKEFGFFTLYVGDDGLVYGLNG